MRGLLGGWLAFGAALAAVALFLFASAVAAERLGLIFHFHPAFVAAGGAWLYRRLESERPCPTRSVSFLVGVAVLIASYQDTLERRGTGVADPGPVTLVISLVGLAAGAWILFRAGTTNAARRSPLT